MSTYCPKCGSLIPPSEINADLNVAHCPACDHISEGGGSDLALPQRPPSGVTVTEQGDELRITWSWFSWTRLLYLTIGLGWIGTSGPKMIAFPTLFGVASLGVGVAVFYGGLAGMLNSTTVTVGSGRLKVAHGPLPWSGGGTYNTSALKRLHAERHVQRSSKGGRTVTYSLEADLRNGKTLTLIQGFDDEVTADFFDKKIERALGIVDAGTA